MINIALQARTNYQTVKISGRNIAVSILPSLAIPRRGILKNWGPNLTILLDDCNKGLDEELNRTFEAAFLSPGNALKERLRNSSTNMVIIGRRNSQFIENVKVISPVIDVIIGSESLFHIDPPLELVFKVSNVIIAVFDKLIIIKL